MKEIKILTEQICEELEDAEKYARCAMKNKEPNRRLGDTYYSLSKQELEHANLLHEQGVIMIREHQGEVPEPMQAGYDWEHEKMIDKMARVRQLLDMYKN